MGHSCSDIFSLAVVFFFSSIINQIKLSFIGGVFSDSTSLVLNDDIMRLWRLIEVRLDDTKLHLRPHYSFTHFSLTCSCSIVVFDNLINVDRYPSW